MMAHNINMELASHSAAHREDGKLTGNHTSIPVQQGEFTAYEEFIVNCPQGVNGDVVHFLISCAVDAFHNNDGGIARGFIRTAIFLECYLLDPINFLSDLHSDKTVVLMCPALQTLLTCLNMTSSRIGLLEFLHSRIVAHCNCLNA